MTDLLLIIDRLVANDLNENEIDDLTDPAGVEAR
jgi:hypothetical protein